MIRRIVFLLVLCVSPHSWAQQAFPFDNEPGQYGVGLGVVKQVDTSRRYGAAPARPIQTAIWYPARKGGQAMRYDDYLKLLGWDDNFDRKPAEQEKFLNEWLAEVTQGNPAAQVAAERASRLWAVRDAVPIPGKYPVVIYSPSISSNVFENAEMMEFLASHGYIVIASPALGINSRWQKSDIEHAEAQAADIRFLVGFARTLPHADPDRITAMGFSWGGLANVLAAVRDERIKALVCLDGSIRYYNALLEKAPYAKPDKLRTPLLFLAQKPSPFERGLKFKRDHSGSFLLGMTNADVYLITMYPMEHAHFGTSYLRLDAMPFDEYSRDEVAQAYALSARYVLNFLNGTMKGDKAGLAYLRKRPEQIGAPAHSTYTKYFPAGQQEANAKLAQE